MFENKVQLTYKIGIFYNALEVDKQFIGIHMC